MKINIYNFYRIDNRSWKMIRFPDQLKPNFIHAIILSNLRFKMLSVYVVEPTCTVYITYTKCIVYIFSRRTFVSLANSKTNAGIVIHIFTKSLVKANCVWQMSNTSNTDYQMIGALIIEMINAKQNLLKFAYIVGYS
jgi:hypothetical protein